MSKEDNIFIIKIINMKGGKEDIILIIMIIAMERGKEAPDVLEGQPPRANRSAANQSRWRGPQRQRMGKRWQEMARDGEARRESTMITPGTPRAT